MQFRSHAMPRAEGFSRLTDYMDPDFAVLQHVIHFEAGRQLKALAPQVQTD